MTPHSILARIASVRLFRKSPVHAYLRLNKWIWKHLPPSLATMPPSRSYGNLLHSLVRISTARRQYFGTYFLRNRPQLELIRRLSSQRGLGSTLKMAFLGCSNGAEVYSILWTIRSGRPDLKVIAHAVDISKEILEVAQKGVYSFKAPELAEAPIFARMNGDELRDMFDVDREGDEVKIKTWIKEGISWHLGDAASPDLLNVMGPQDMVVANNFLCHMTPPIAERCLRNIARLVTPTGYLLVSGIDLDVRTKVALDLGWKPVRDLMEDIHDGDPSVRGDWPWQYWGLEPFSKRRRDWKLRYASAFQLGGQCEEEISSLQPGSLTSRKRKKISFFGNFGQGNLGNECTLQAILYNLRQHWPDAEVNCICTGPEATAKTHNIAAVPMHDIFVKPGLLRNNPLARFLRRVFIRIPGELYRWAMAYRTLEGTDMLIVPGTQFLSDNLTGPFGWPYLAFKWSVTAKLRGCKLLFVSVGVGPLRHPLSRVFVKSALLLADFRSYRDDLSRQYMRHIGFDATNDPVYPDLAFSLPTPTIPRGRQSNRGRPVIAVGVTNYRGQYGSTPPQHHADDIYRRYIDTVTAFVAWLLEHTYTVRLVIGDVSYDTQVLADLRKALNERDVKYENPQLIDEPIESVEELFLQLATCDIVVSPRFHNIVLGLLLYKPVISLSYHEKFVSLMDGVGLSKYCQHIDDLDVDKLIDQFIEIEKNAEDLTPSIKQKTEEHRKALDRQYTAIFKDV